jgi:UTP-glucose-1-phosphate uridylyltransferase
MHICASGRVVGFRVCIFVRGTCCYWGSFCRFAGGRFFNGLQTWCDCRSSSSLCKQRQSQLLVMEVDGPDISKYGVVVPNGAGIAGMVEKPDASDASSNLASIGRYVLTPDIFEILRGLSAGSGGEIQLADAINIHAQQCSVETVRLNSRRFDCGSVHGFMAASNHEFENSNFQS